MKLSLRWIFDHLNASYDLYNASDIVKKLITSTAEIEAFYTVAYDHTHVTLAQVKECNEKEITLFSHEHNKEFTLPYRNDAVLEHFYMINIQTSKWVTFSEWHSDKEGLLPSFSAKENDIKGAWKQEIQDDIIFEVDNKSITNRPDLWGHRGFAREISVLCDITLKTDNEIYANIESYSTAHGWNIVNNAPNICSQFAIMELSDIIVQPSFITIAARLCAVDARPINTIVDMTNYVMLDIGHPMHAFDSSAFNDHTVIVRQAHADEQLPLLDGTILTLTSKDMVIASKEHALSLAGVKGGRSSGITQNSKNILIEAGVFEATAIRLSAARHKLRTDASARFEKTLDQEGNKKALQRFVALCDQYEISYILSSSLVLYGDVVKPLIIEFSHEALESKIGVFIESSYILDLLHKLEMSAQYNEKDKIYTISVPSFRSSKDVRISEDIIEEIARLIGYDTIAPSMPFFQTQPHNHDVLYKKRKLKSYLACTMHLSEVENYALYDNTFIKKINYIPQDPLHLKNPLTEDRTTMVTCLIPHLLQNVYEQYEHHDECGFFELAHIFNKGVDSIVEQTRLAGIIYNKKEVDFYRIKDQLQTMFKSVGYEISYREYQHKPWWTASYKLLDMYYNDIYIGTMGQVSESLTSHFTKGKMIAFECNIDALLSLPTAVKKVISLSSVPSQYSDVSCIVDHAVTTAYLTSLIQNVDDRIKKVTLIDTYHQKEWGHKKSMTFNCTIVGNEAVLSKEEMEKVLQSIYQTLEHHGAQAR